ncbi:YecA family protein [Paenibacillus sp. S150]|uniref:YecA family protein n=1 Tax=Paenibacillus sp. S150 TaxID=2749826 RepID=UPI001C5A076A|nr:SEC-C metal-binding domain-containing protein [Paenibacillus sp. S150]MBW4081961.1 SEC-C domain-containing protein [Paenibacillus sp. S150]
MIGRNDPCSCGSGKKYKQCCLLKQAEDQTLQVKARHFFERKFKLTNDLYSFLAQKQGGEWVFNHQKILPFDFSLGYYRDGAGNMWSYFCRVYDNGLRGIDWFVEERGQRYSGEDREMLERWRGMRFSCYQLVDQYEQGAVIEDIWTKERYRMPYCETMIKLPPWTAAVGMIEPYIEDWCIHGVFMWGHPDVASGVKTRVEQLQEEAAKASEQKMSPVDILAANYPEMLEVCNRISSRNGQPFSHMEDTGEQIFETRQYTCEYPELLEQMLLDTRDEYILAPGKAPEEGTIVISRADKLDGILGTIPADRREQLGLNEIEIAKDLATIVIDKKGVTVSGWQSAELEATLELLESKLSAASGLTRVNERREARQFPKELVLKGYNIITDKTLSDQEVNAYGNLPVQLQWYRNTQEKVPAESAEMLVRKREYEQYRINPGLPNLNFLRIALGLPESPFTG